MIKETKKLPSTLFKLEAVFLFLLNNEDSESIHRLSS